MDTRRLGLIGDRKPPAPPSTPAYATTLNPFACGKWHELRQRLDLEFGLASCVLESSAA